MRLIESGLGAQNPAQTLRFSCREPNVPETWMASEASGRSIAKLATFETASTRMRLAEIGKQLVAFALRRTAGDDGSPSGFASAFQLIEIHADQQRGFARMPVEDGADGVDFRGFSDAMRNLSRASADGVGHLQSSGMGRRTSVHCAVAIQP